MKKRITWCKINRCGYANEVYTIFDDGSEGAIFTYYPDELSFEEHDFIGLTEYEALELYRVKDISYLRS